MQVEQARAAVAAMPMKEVDFSRQHDTSHGHLASLTTEYLDSAEDIGDAMDQSAGVSSTSAHIPVAIGLALGSDAGRRWVLSRMAATQDADAFMKVTRTSAPHLACVQL